MKTLPAYYAPRALELDDDQRVPEELVGRLYRADEAAVAEVIAGYSPAQRANLAMFCYRKTHLQPAGLAIAASCDRSSLVQAWGTALGEALYDQSRHPLQHVPDPIPGQRCVQITLPRFVPSDWGVSDIMPADQDEPEGSFDWTVECDGATEH